MVPDQTHVTTLPSNYTHLGFFPNSPDMEVSFWKKVLFYVIEPGKTLIEPISEEIQLAENNLKFTKEILTSQFFLGFTYSETHLLKS